MGAMADLGIHKTDLIQYLLGQTIVETKATLTTLDKQLSDGSLIGVDDNAVCIYTMSGGALGTMTTSWTNYGPGKQHAHQRHGGFAHVRRPRAYPDPAAQGREPGMWTRTRCRPTITRRVPA